MTEFLGRELGREVVESLRSLPVVAVSGLRQAGKTTFLREDTVLGKRRFLTLDDMATLERARHDPEGLLDSDEPLTIDEAQYCPELFPALKRAVDRRRRNGWYLLSGSANFLLLKSISESLAGRATYLTLHPMTHRERAGAIEREPFLVKLFTTGKLPRVSAFEPVRDADVLAGGLPPPALGIAPDNERWFQGYERTYLERDVRALTQIADLMSFRRVLKLAALRTAQLTNVASIAAEAKLPATTTSRYLDVLETSFVSAPLQPFLRSRKARLLKTPKLYVTDSGLAAHLCQVGDLSPAANERLRGPLYETFVAQNLRAIVEVHLRRAELGFWNVQGRHEVDFVISTRSAVLAIEIKAGPRWTEADLSGLRAFASGRSDVRALVLAYQGREAYAIEPGIFAVPIGMLLT
jgi:hypothetical protein